MNERADWQCPIRPDRLRWFGWVISWPLCAAQRLVRSWLRVGSAWGRCRRSCRDLVGAKDTWSTTSHPMTASNCSFAWNIQCKLRNRPIYNHSLPTFLRISLKKTNVLWAIKPEIIWSSPSLLFTSSSLRIIPDNTSFFIFNNWKWPLLRYAHSSTRGKKLFFILDSPA